RHHVRPHLAHAAVAQQVAGLDLPLRRTAAGPGDQAGAGVAHVVVGQPRVGDGIAHRDVRIGGRVAHEALELAVDLRVEVDLRLARDVAAQAKLGIFGDETDAGLERAQRRRDAGLVVADARNDAHAGDDDAAVAIRTVHQTLSVMRYSRTRRPSAT